MKLQVKNFNLVKEAGLSLNGLTVIAGDNDTGKSTVGKLLFSIIKAHQLSKVKDQGTNMEEILQNVLTHVFENLSFNKSEILLSNEDVHFNITGKPTGELETQGNIKDFKFEDIIYIESPIVWLFLDYFTRLSKEKDRVALEEDKYLYLLKDVHQKLFNKSNPLIIEDEFKDVLMSISTIINGSFLINNDKFFFTRNNDGRQFPIGGVASGVQSFAMLDVLTRNGHIHNNSVLIIDEPEIHLHPKWEYEYAKLITDYVKLGVHVVVTTHSMYMVKALKEFTRDIPEKVNFYLTTRNDENQVNYEDVTLEVFKIFKKFSEPLQSLVWRKP